MKIQCSHWEYGSIQQPHSKAQKVNEHWEIELHTIEDLENIMETHEVMIMKNFMWLHKKESKSK